MNKQLVIPNYHNVQFCIDTLKEYESLKQSFYDSGNGDLYETEVKGWKEEIRLIKNYYRLSQQLFTVIFYATKWKVENGESFRITTKCESHFNQIVQYFERMGIQITSGRYRTLRKFYNSANFQNN